MAYYYNVLKKAGNTITMFLPAIGLIVFYEMYGWSGLWGWVILMALIGIVKMIIERETVMMALRNIETALFGMPLDKEFWKNQKPKLGKIRWKKQ